VKKDIRLIGLTGTNGAGKGEVALYFQKKGFEYFSLSDLIREELKKRGLEVNRDNLIQMGNRLRQRFGPDILARRILRKIKKNAVIDSIRNPAEVERLRQHPHFILIAVDAPLEVRYQRAKKRGRDESASTLEEFRKKEGEEMEGSETGQQLRACFKLADSVIINDGLLVELHRKLEVIL
jgi:dephospho-CoA kinase